MIVITKFDCSHILDVRCSQYHYAYSELDASTRPLANVWQTQKHQNCDKMINATPRVIKKFAEQTQTERENSFVLFLLKRQRVISKLDQIK